VQRRVRLRRLPRRPDDRVPVGNQLACGNQLRRNLHGSNNLRAENVVVLHAELQIHNRMRERDVKPLVPRRVRRVLQHARARHRRLRHRNRHVRVTRDDPPVVALLPRPLASTVGGVLGVEFDSVAAGYAAAETLREDVHVRQVPRLNNFQIQVTMKVGDAIVVAARVRHVPVRRVYSFEFTLRG